MSDKTQRGTIHLESAQVLSQQSYDGDQYILRVQAADCAATARAGQFACQAKRATSGAAWRTKLGGSPVEKMLRYPQWLTKMLGPRLAPQGLDWDYS